MIYWIWFTQIKGIGIKTQRILLDYFHTPREIYYASKKELSQVKKLTSGRVDAIMNGKSLDSARRILEQCEKKGIKIMTLEDRIYPDDAKEILDMPILLYYKGHPDENSIGAAVVGARRCTNEGKERAIQLTFGLVEHGINVVSGMAKGIDSYAHTACLKAGGYTVAVMGCGLDICYPKEHNILMERIEQQGLLLSEYPPGTLPDSYHFPRRNRIIAAWSREIYIPEAGSRSGAWITAKYGKRYGRKVIDTF